MSFSVSAPNHLLGYFNIFPKDIRNTSSCAHLKTNFYYQKCPNITHPAATVSEISTLSLGKPKHRYEKFSTPIPYEHIPRFQQKGLIVVWPQRKRLYRKEKLTVLTWFLAHLLYFLYIANILPTANVMSLDKPPWNYKVKLRKPLKKDYIIEPDWDSKYYNTI